MERATTKWATFLDIAENLALLSTCHRASVGCIIVPDDWSAIHAIGYNGQPRGTVNDACSDTTGQCGCIHAEANAIAKLDTPRVGLTLITTVSPCLNCAGLIVNCGKIASVVFIDKYREFEGPQKVLHRAGVTCAQQLYDKDKRHADLHEWREARRELLRATARARENPQPLL